jgi:hypothetical protein
MSVETDAPPLGSRWMIPKAKGWATFQVIAVEHHGQTGRYRVTLQQERRAVETTISERCWRLWRGKAYEINPRRT